MPSFLKISQNFEGLFSRFFAEEVFLNPLLALPDSYLILLSFLDQVIQVLPWWRLTNQIIKTR